MPQNQLLDALFGLFREKAFWSVKELRLKTEQPEAYLKETLGQIATLHRSGAVRVLSYLPLLLTDLTSWTLQHNGLWELMANFKDEFTGSPSADGVVPFSSDLEVPTDVKVEGVDDDDDDDDDMEEIP